MSARDRLVARTSAQDSVPGVVRSSHQSSRRLPGEQALQHQPARLEPGIESRPEIVLVDGDHALADPAHEDQRFGAIAHHAVVPGLEPGQHIGVDIAPAVDQADHARPDCRKTRGVDIGLDIGHPLRGLGIAMIDDQRVEAVLPPRLFPIERQEIRIVRTDDLGVGGGDGARLRIELPRQSVEGNHALPVEQRIPSGNRRPAHDTVLRIPDRRASGRNQSDVSVRVGHDDRLHRCDVIDHGRLELLDAPPDPGLVTGHHGRIVLGQRDHCRAATVPLGR